MKETNQTTSNSATKSLVLVDVENLAGGTDNPESAEQALQALETLCGPDTMFVAACSHRSARRYSFQRPDWRWLWRSGKDGADKALLNEVGEGVPLACNRVVVASGDGIFAPMVADLAVQGFEVTVVARSTSLARTMKLAASRVAYVDSWILDAKQVAA